MSPSSPSSDTTSRVWWRQPRGRLFIIAGAVIVVLALVAGGFAVAHMVSDDAWVAEESYDFDICTLVNPADAEPFLQAYESRSGDNIGNTPDVRLIGRGLTYQVDTESYQDRCTYRFTSKGTSQGTSRGELVQLSIGPAGDQPETDERTDGADLPDVGDSARFYPPDYTQDGAAVTHVGEARIELTLEHRDNVDDGAGAAGARDLLVGLTEAVIDRFPASFTMPGQLAEGDCAQLTDEAATLFDADPTYSRSYVAEQPDQEGRSFDCSFAHSDSAHVTVTVTSGTTARQEIAGLDNFDSLDVDGTKVYRDNNQRHYVVDPDERSLVKLHLARSSTNPEDQEPPEGAELQHLVELAEAALRSPSIG